MIRQATATTAFCGLVVALTAPAARACVIAGNCDAFAPPTEPVFLRPDFANWFAPNANHFCNGGALSRPFDGGADLNCAFGYSFTGLSDFCCPADLTIRMKGGGSNDSLALVFKPGATPGFGWTRFLRDLELETDPTTGLPLCTHNAGAPDGIWGTADDMTCVLNLCALPTGTGVYNAQQEIRDQTALDVYVQDDTEADCITLCNSFCQCINPPSGMVAWYAGDDTTAADQLGNHDGAFVGSPASSPEWKVGGGAMFFESSSGTYAIVPDHNALDFGTSDFSIDLWVQRTAGTGVQPLVDKRGPHPTIPASTRGYMLFLNNGLLSLQLFDQVGSFNYISGLVVPVDNNWHFVAVTVDRDSSTGLVMAVGNKPTGQLMTQSFDPRNRIGDLDNSANLLIGAHSLSAGLVFDGLMDELELYSRALTQVEVESIFLANTAGKCKCCPTPRIEGDIVPCPCGDGIVDLNDILAVLDSFAGIDPCP